jgi:heme/copper-type cytochrome/quinol oxidase subunit 2
MRLNRFANLLLLSAAAILAATSQTFACSMCKANVANAENSNEISATINTAILILLAPTLALIGGLVKLVFKYRHYVNFTTSGAECDTQQRQRDPARHGLLPRRCF